MEQGRGAPRPRPAVPTLITAFFLFHKRTAFQSLAMEMGRVKSKQLDRLPCGFLRSGRRLAPPRVLAPLGTFCLTPSHFTGSGSSSSATLNPGRSKFWFLVFSNVNACVFMLCACALQANEVDRNDGKLSHWVFSLVCSASCIHSIPTAFIPTNKVTPSPFPLVCAG